MSERDDTMARRLLQLRERKDLTGREADEAEQAYKDYEEYFWSQMEDQKKKSINLDLGEPYGNVVLQRRDTTTYRVFDKRAFRDWVKEQGLDDELIKPEARQAQLNQYAKTSTEAGNGLPDGVEPNTRRYVSVTRKRS